MKPATAVGAIRVAVPQARTSVAGEPYDCESNLRTLPLASSIFAVLFLFLCSTGEATEPTPPSAEPSAASASTSSTRASSSKPAMHQTRVGVAPKPSEARANYLTADQIARHDPISFTASQISLRQALQNLSAAIRLSIFLDRRIDPEQIIDLDFNQVTLDDALDRIAARGRAGVALVGPVAYLGPQETARQLRTLCALRTAEAAKLPAAAKKAALESRTFAWPSLATPAEVVDRLAIEAGIEVEGADQLPHDLLAGVDLPAMPWVDRLSLFAGQFGLTFGFERGGKTIKLVPIPESVQLEKSYPAGRDPAATIERLKAQAPDAEIELVRGRIMVRGRVEDHDLLAPSRENPAGPATTPGAQAYTLKMENVPLDAFLAQLGPKVGVTFQLDEPALKAAGIKPSSTLSVDVTTVPLDGLLHAALDPLGLRWQRAGQTITVTVKEK